MKTSILSLSKLLYLFQPINPARNVSWEIRAIPKTQTIAIGPTNGPTKLKSCFLPTRKKKETGEIVASYSRCDVRKMYFLNSN